MEKVERGMKAEAVALYTRVRYHNKLLDMWRMTKRRGGSSNGGSGGCECNGGGGWSTSVSE